MFSNPRAYVHTHVAKIVGTQYITPCKRRVTYHCAICRTAMGTETIESHAYAPDPDAPTLLICQHCGATA